jgi:predicted dehydrogenase
LTVGVGLIGANRWARIAHVPGYAGFGRARLVAVCDLQRERAEALAAHAGIPRVYADYRELLADPDVQLVDICTPTHTHVQLSRDAIAAGKHVLCEKPLAERTADAFAAAAAAGAQRIRTKLGFAFRHSPALRRLRAWVTDGTLGELQHLHGLQLDAHVPDPDFVLRHVPPDAPRDRLLPSSIVGYGATVVDLMRWCGGEFHAVCASMRASRGGEPAAIEDGTAAVVEFASGAQGLLQTSYVAWGNAPGVEIRAYGSKGSAIARLTHEHGRAETLALTGSDGAWTRVEPDPAAYPPGTDAATPWPFVYLPNLVRQFVDEIVDGGSPECTFFDGAKSQQIVDALVRSHHERAWVVLGPTRVISRSPTN